MLRNPPKLKSYRLTGLNKVMPRMFRRGYGLGGMMRRRRRRGFIRGNKKTQNKVHTFVRWCDKDNLYPDASGPSVITETGVDRNLVYSFNLNNVVNPTDFANLFDRYKINKITMYLEPCKNDTDATTTPQNKKISVVWDDDANALTNEDDYLEYGNCKRFNAISTRTIKLVLYPKIAQPVLNTAGALTAFQSVPANKNWLKIEDRNVPHFGFKIFVPANINNIGVQTFTVRVKYHISVVGSK